MAYNRDAYLAAVVEHFKPDFAASGYPLKTVDWFPFKHRKLIPLEVRHGHQYSPPKPPNGAF